MKKKTPQIWEHALFIVPHSFFHELNEDVAGGKQLHRSVGTFHNEWCGGGGGFLPNFLGQVNSDGEEQRDWLLFEWAGSKVNTSNRIFVQIRHLHIYTHTCSVCTTTTSC